VSLTSVCCKLLEHIVCRHLLSHLEKHKILTNLNHGFRAGFSCETQLITTFHDIAKQCDKGAQVDVAILDFSKAFDTVPHSKLLGKLHNYGITGNIHLWLNSFLTTRSMRVVVEGETSRELPVVSGVPQGTVLGPVLFLCHINDLPDCVRSQVRLFADDCLLYRTIRTWRDHITLQEDLERLEEWATRWGMRFNAGKCYILSVNSKTSHFYSVNKQFLKQVPTTPYLGVMLSENLKWSPHIAKTVGKASSTLGFLRRNLRSCPTACRRTAYISLIRSQLEYASIVWDPYLRTDIDKLERVQRRAVRFICNDYKSRDPGSVSRMLQTQELPLLHQRRKSNRLTFLYRVVGGLVPAVPKDQFVTPARSDKRRICARRFDNYEAQNLVTRHARNNSRGLVLEPAKSKALEHSFFVRTVVEWNQLAEQTVQATTPEAFRSMLQFD